MREHGLDVVRRWVGSSRNWIESFLAEAKSNPSIIAIVAMGSAVRERGHRRSDMDLLVLYSGKRPLVEAPLEVDIRWYPINKLEELLSSGHEIVCWALKFGFALYDVEGRWTELERKWKDRIPMPSRSDALDRAQRSLQRAKEMLEAEDEAAASDLLLSAVTQFVRAQLIEHQVFPASRPELPKQLARVCPNDPLVVLLEDAMYQDEDAHSLIERLDSILAAH